ncbi:YopX family protein [Streptococcus mitis]|uniref:YopX family protein n=1 Tax=Streptococcus mitis TaxID=28037 RepID=UPI0021B75464|nr:YopX family protein [Streptococcus mitis]
MLPKFRAWDKHSQKMFANDELLIWNNNVYANDSKKLTCNNLKGWSIDDEYLMQSTGLRDKNGKEIFEGDILDYKGRKALVRWHGSYASFIYRFVDELQNRKTEWKPLYLAYMKCEIIGNIYENPEFLEDKK